MATLTPQQQAFITRYLGDIRASAPLELTDADVTVVNELSKVAEQVIAAHPQAKAMIAGLLAATKDALARKDADEYQRQAVMLADRLQTLEQMEKLPDVKSVLDTGLLEMSRAMTPEEETAVDIAYQGAKEAMADLPDDIRAKAEMIAGELARLQARGNQLIAAIQTGQLDVRTRAAHHNEIDQICVAVEGMTQELEALLRTVEAVA